MPPKPLFLINYILSSGIKILLLASVSISFLLTLTSHPIIIISLIRTQALLACSILWVIITNPWFSYILFLVFIGGLIVLFIYIASLASNENISLELKNTPTKTVTLFILACFFAIILINLQTFKESSITSRVRVIFKVYTPNVMFITSITILYLLLALIIIVKVITIKEGALRSFK